MVPRQSMNIIFLTLLTFSSCSFIDLNKVVSTYIGHCLLVFNSETLWYGKKLNGRDGYQSQLEMAKRTRKCAVEDAVKLRRLRTVLGMDKFGFENLCKLSTITFVEEAVSEYDMQVHHASIAYLNALPSLFTVLEAKFKLDPGLCSILYSCIYPYYLKEGSTDILDKDCLKRFILSDDIDIADINPMRMIIVGLQSNSYRCKRFWNELYKHTVTNFGVAGFDKIFLQICPAIGATHRLILNNRLPVSVEFPTKFKSVSEFVENTKFLDGKAASLDTIPYVLHFQSYFDQFILELSKEGKLAPHPITGKVLLTKKLLKKDLNFVLKMFKIMVCLNLRLPRLAMKMEEYDQTEDMFMYCPKLEKVLSSVSKNPSVHYYKPVALLDCKTALSELFNTDADLCHQFIFMSTQLYLGQLEISFAPKEMPSRSLAIFCQPRRVAFINTTLTREEYIWLMANVTKVTTDEDNICAYMSTLEAVPESNSSLIKIVEGTTFNNEKISSSESDMQLIKSHLKLVISNPVQIDDHYLVFKRVSEFIDRLKWIECQYSVDRLLDDFIKRGVFERRDEKTLKLTAYFEDDVFMIRAILWLIKWAEGANIVLPTFDDIITQRQDKNWHSF